MARHFAPREFTRSDGRDLSPLEWSRGRKLADLLDAARDFHGDVVWVTSFVRVGDPGSHGQGWAVDIQPAEGGEVEIRRLAGFLAALYRPGAEGSPLHQVIYEAPEPGQRRGHVHTVLAGYSGRATPGYLVDVEGDRRYVRLPLPRLQVVGA